MLHYAKAACLAGCVACMYASARNLDTQSHLSRLNCEKMAMLSIRLVI